MPGATTLITFFYVYVSESTKHKKRLKAHYKSKL